MLYIKINNLWILILTITLTLLAAIKIKDPCCSLKY